MSRRYAILMRAGAPVAETDPGDWELRREGFSLLGFAFPAVWLLVHRLWKWAALAFVIPIAFAWLAPETYLVVSLAIGLLVGFEGRERIIVSRETSGWRCFGVLEAASRIEAEDKLAALVTRGGLAMRAARAVRPRVVGSRQGGPGRSGGSARDGSMREA